MLSVFYSKDDTYIQDARTEPPPQMDSGCVRNYARVINKINTTNYTISGVGSSQRVTHRDTITWHADGNARLPV